MKTGLEWLYWFIVSAGAVQVLGAIGLVLVAIGIFVGEYVRELRSFGREQDEERGLGDPEDKP